MKNNSIIVTLALMTALNGCGQADQINARSDRALFRTVSDMQRRLPKEQQVEFQVSFWSLKQYAESESEFREMVHRKSAPEIIELGKENFVTQAAAGNRDFIKYSSWNSMIADLVEERKKSALRPRKGDVRDKGNLIHNM